MTKIIHETNTLIVGASAAGLACACQLAQKKIAYSLIEQQSHVAHAWRQHYNRLHLHTQKKDSSLPFLCFHDNIQKYPSKKQVVEYLERYCDNFDINPTFNTTATKISKAKEYWVTETNKGNFRSENVIICTGLTQVPNPYTKTGLETFTGKVMHSSQYRNGSEFAGQKVLVVGFGNSACEIALCLHEHGAKPSMSVRSAVNIVPRDLLGIPILTLSKLFSRLPTKIVDGINAPLLRIINGNIEKYGLKKLPYGPMQQIAKDHKIPLLNTGTLNIIKAGSIKIHGDFTKIDHQFVHFHNGDIEAYDALVLGIGYHSGIDRILPLSSYRLADISKPIKQRVLFGKDNLYFCGFHVSATGMLREIAKESGIIAEHIANT